MRGGHGTSTACEAVSPNASPSAPAMRHAVRAEGRGISGAVRVRRNVCVCPGSTTMPSGIETRTVSVKASAPPPAASASALVQLLAPELSMVTEARKARPHSRRDGRCSAATDASEASCAPAWPGRTTASARTAAFTISSR